MFLNIVSCNCLGLMFFEIFYIIDKCPGGGIGIRVPPGRDSRKGLKI
jgi:hypothetical protein